MISRDDVQRLIHRPGDDKPVLSLFLDMSVTSDNKRRYDVFLRDQRSGFAELDSDREGHHVEAVGKAFADIERWIETEFDESNKGVAIYASVGGDWLESFQFPVTVDNRLVVDDRPVVGPLTRILGGKHRHGVLVVDREHLKMISVDMGSVVSEHVVETEPYPSSKDVKPGGEAAADFQRRKAEELRHFFKEYAVEVGEFVRRYRPDDLIVLGTNENVKAFIEFLPDPLQKMVVHTGHAPAMDLTSQVLQRLRPVFDDLNRQEEEQVLELLRGRVEQRHYAASGFRDTLEQLQEGKVDTLVIARDVEHSCAQCTQCGFYLLHRDGGCPYCGGETRDGIDLVETMVRMAADQEVAIEFVEPEALSDMHGVGALLKF